MAALSRQRVLAMVGRKQDSDYGLTSLSPAGNACQYQCARVTSAIPLLISAKWIMPDRGLTRVWAFKSRLNFWQRTPPENVKLTPNITIIRNASNHPHPDIKWPPLECLSRASRRPYLRRNSERTSVHNKSSPMLN